MKRLDLDVLEMVIAVADTGSFARGAEAVNRSASAVSMQIKAIEEAMGKALFVRNTRHVAITPEGKTLLEYARRMVSMREEAWTSIVRSEVRGRVTIGVPDDYASALLPKVLRKFVVAHPNVEIRVIGQPSHVLLPMLKDNTLDLACVTNMKGLSGEFIRHEPMVWAGSSASKAWLQRPLPLAVFTPGSVSRGLAIRVLQMANIKYRMSYESPSLMGLISMVEAGLAVAPLAKCSVPSHLLELSQNEGLPPLSELEVVLVRSSRSARSPCDFLAEQILSELR